MQAFYFWSADEIEEFIRTCEMALASPAQQATSPDGNITVKGDTALWTMLRKLYQAYKSKTGKGPGGSSRPRFVDVVHTNGYGPQRRLGRRGHRSPFDAF